MEFGLSDEQKMLDDSVRKFLSSEVSIDVIRDVCAQTATDETPWQSLVAMGLSGILIDESQGGAGLGMLDAMVVSEALGYAACPGPFLSSSVMAAHYLSVVGDSDTLAGIASGQHRVGIAFGALTGDRSSDAVKEEGGRLEGRSLFALDADASAYLVATAEGTVYWVNTSDLSRRVLPTIDGTRSICELIFETSAATRLSDDETIALGTLQRGRAIQAADSLGAAQYMLDQAVAYSMERKQFNRVIGSFQAVKHMCAEMASQLEPCRAFAWYAGHAFDENESDADLTACHINAHVAEVAQFVAKTSTEVHGGMGFTDLVGLHYWFKRIGFNRQVLGSPEWVRNEAACLQGLVA